MTKPDKDPGRVAAGETLAECNKRVRQENKKKGGLKQSEDAKDPGLERGKPGSSRITTRSLWPGP